MQTQCQHINVESDISESIVSGFGIRIPLFACVISTLTECFPAIIQTLHK